MKGLLVGFGRGRWAVRAWVRGVATPRRGCASAVEGEEIIGGPFVRAPGALEVGVGSAGGV